MSDSDNRKRASIPAWQQNHNSDTENKSAPQTNSADPSTQTSHAELLEQAQEFLKDESIKGASRERKVAFLEKKGLQADDITRLLDGETTAVTEEQSEELRTVYDSNKTESTTSQSSNESTTQKPAEVVSAPEPKPQQRPSQRDIPPIVTYPEFLIKPQKPPPLITIPRLINGAYVFAGVATLTYSASKYIVEPMLANLTEARHSLASSTLADLEKFNDKLESSVSHVPYIASAAALKKQQEQEDDLESITSDPTELFHRDIATQTTPSLSRTQSMDDSSTHLDATTQQVMRLKSLHETLTSLALALDPKELPYLPPPANKKFRETISDFQNVLDKLETTYNPLRGDYYSTIYAQPSDSKLKGGKDSDMAAKVRTEIRNLKGAFLSARNFPTAPRPANAYGSMPR